MSNVDPQESPLDADPGLTQEPVDAGSDDDLDPFGEDAHDEVADGDVLSDPDIALDEEPRAGS